MEFLVWFPLDYAIRTMHGHEYSVPSGIFRILWKEMRVPRHQQYAYLGNGIYVIHWPCINIRYNWAAKLTIYVAASSNDCADTIVFCYFAYR